MIGKQIDKLEEVITEYLKNGSKIIETIITNLTAPGENYGSEIYKVDLKIKNTNEEIEDLNVVAKQIPETEFYQEVFNIQVTFNAEKEFYKTIIPEIQNFQNKHGVGISDDFPKFFGGRNNLNGVNKIVDKDALIVLENLKVTGYKNIDRYIGFDLPTSKLILKSLAKFHATTIALKLKESETFEQKLKRNCACFFMQTPPIDLSKETDDLVEVLKDCELPRSTREVLRKSMVYMGAQVKTFREPFVTLVHTDFWINNIMIKFDKEVATDVKIVDFQLYTYDSPVRDLLFFLFTSVKTEVLKESLEILLKCYHEVFLNTLSAFKCDTSPFSYDNFMREFPDTMKTMLGSMLFMLIFIVRGRKGGVLNKGDPAAVPTFSADHVTADDRDRIKWLLEEFDRRGWLSF